VFVSYREAHSLIGLYSADDKPICHLAPSTSFDSMPQWSLDSTRIAFVR
jgi:Tol biopolymer transport system component